MKAKSSKAALFIEGRWVPFVSINVTSTMGSAPVASIELVPLKECKYFLPRTSVAIFVKDESYPDDAKPWVLLFSGEVMGFAFSKSPSSRSFTLSCVSESTYWDNAKQYYLNTAIIPGKVVGTGGTDILETKKTGDIAKAAGEETRYTVTTTKADITKRVLEEMNSGKDLAEASLAIIKTISNVNSFYRFGQQKYRLNDRISFVSSGNLKELIDINNKEEFLQSLFGMGASDQVTARQVLYLIMSTVFHKASEPLAPSSIIKGGKETIASFLFYPESFVLPPPNCNILFPEHYAAFGTQRNFAQENTRLIFQPSIPQVLKSMGGNDVFLPTYYAPVGFRDFHKKHDASPEKQEAANKHDKAPPGQGKADAPVGKDAELTSITLQDFNHLSYEEIMRGIEYLRIGAPPACSLFTRTMDSAKRGTYFDQLADYLFYQNRYQVRSGGTSGPLNLAPIPGLNMLIIDASEVGDHIVAQLQSISHNISSTGGARTSYQMNYVRSVDERDMWSHEIVEPNIPPWYDHAVFGSKSEVTPSDYQGLSAEHKDMFQLAKRLNKFPNVGSFYQKLIGTYNEKHSKGSDSITNKTYSTLLGATLRIEEEYLHSLQTGGVEEYINTQTRRSYVLLEDYFKFLGAELTADQKGMSFSENVNTVFQGKIFDGGYVDTAPNQNKRDAAMKPYMGKVLLDKRRIPVDMYRKSLAENRGFRG